MRRCESFADEDADGIRATKKSVPLKIRISIKTIRDQHLEQIYSRSLIVCYYSHFCVSCGRTGGIIRQFGHASSSAMVGPAHVLRTSGMGDRIVTEDCETQTAEQWSLRVPGDVWKMKMTCKLPPAKQKRRSNLALPQQRENESNQKVGKEEQYSM